MNTTGTRIRAIILSASALVLAACSDSGNEPDSPTTAIGVPMRFAADSRNARAEITIDNLRSFNVWGSLRNPDSATERDWRDVFSNDLNTTPTTVNYTDADGWTYGDDLRYWQQGFSYTFLAFAAAYETDTDGLPVTSPVTPEFHTAANGNSHFLSISNFNGTKGTDLAYATEARDLTTEPLNTSVVDLSFHHLTAFIEIVGRVDPQLGKNYQIKISRVSLLGMNTIGSWSGESFNPATGNLGTWASSTPAIGTAPYAEALYDNFKINSKDNATPTNLLHPSADQGHDLMMIPQEIPVTACVEITYRHIGKPDAEVTGHPEQNITLNLYEASLAVGAEWQAGKAYRYTVNFGAADNIIFDTPTVDQWNYQVGGNIIVQ